MSVYNDYYGFHDSPFRISPDPDFVYLSRTHREGLAGLVYAICERKGFTLMTGEVGTGKTTLVHTLLTQLGPRARSAFIFNPRLSRKDLYHDLLSELRLPPAASIRAAVRCLQRYLLEQFSAGVPVVLILDEAHALSEEILEEVRVLSNFETPAAKLLEIVLVGQPEILRRLEDDRLRALRQRISVLLRLEPLSLEESIAYLRFRMNRAGRDHDPFTPMAHVALYEHTNGLPRLLNTLADNALLLGLARERDLALLLGEGGIDADLIVAAAAQLGVHRRTRMGAWTRWRHRRPQVDAPVEMPTISDFIERLLEPQR